MVCHQRQGPVHVRGERGQLSAPDGSSDEWRCDVWLRCPIVCPPPQDVAALESQPLLGFVLKADYLQKTQFKLYHKNILYYIFKADDTQTAQRYVTKSEAYCDKRGCINVFLLFTGGLNRSRVQLFFSSLSNPEKTVFLTVFYLSAPCLLKSRCFIACIRCFNYVSTVNIITQMFVSSRRSPSRFLFFLEAFVIRAQSICNSQNILIYTKRFKRVKLFSMSFTVRKITMYTCLDYNPSLEKKKNSGYLVATENHLNCFGSFVNSDGCKYCISIHMLFIVELLWITFPCLNSEIKRLHWLRLFFVI